MSHVFISYSKQNKDYAEKLADFLQDNGFDVWIDRVGIEYSERWWDSIVAGIRESGAFIVIMTPEAKESDWVYREIHVALHLQIKVFPLLLAGENWELFYGDHYVSVQDRSMPEDGFLVSLGKRATRKSQEMGKNRSNITPENGETVSTTLSIIRPDVSSILQSPLEWCEVPAGEFLYGENKETLELPTFYISKYPITHAQFQIFLKEKGGFYDGRWWDGLAASYLANKNPGDQQWKNASHPRENVSWYDAIAFCRWLSFRLALSQSSLVLGRGHWEGNNYEMMSPFTWAVRLPRELEWEKAARGTDGSYYPWGNEFDKYRCNTKDAGIRRTTPVDRYPKGASPYGIWDMSGNVWEWCLTEYDSGRDDISNDNARVLRGGSWLNSDAHARTTYRFLSYPDVRDSFIGFRVVCTPPILDNFTPRPDSTAR